LAAEIRQALAIEPELVKGASGIFDIAADGALVFSKHRDGRFPGTDEIIQALRKFAAQ
jgi:selT/selW/selH-like putative selenoprotein